MSFLWLIPRHAFKFFASLCSLYSTPPIKDHVEFLLIIFSLHLILYPNTAHYALKLLLFISVSLLHLKSGLRWQLSLLYLSTILNLMYFQNEIIGILSTGLFSVSVVLCILFPMNPPLIPSNFQDIGVQDICLQGKEEIKFWVRFYYPSKMKVVSNYEALNHFFRVSILDVVLMGLIFHYGSNKEIEMKYLYFFWFWHFLFEIGEHVVFGVRKTKYLPDHISHKGIAMYSKMPEILFSHMQLFQICGIEDGEIIVPKTCLHQSKADTKESATENTKKKTDSLKIAFVLHGLSGYRSTYTSTCLELASLGYLVISPEFGDATPASSLLPDGFVRYYQSFQGSQKSIEYHQFRQKQLEQRVDEINVIMSYLQDISKDNPIDSTQIKQKYSPHIRWNSLTSSSTASTASSKLTKSLFIQSIRKVSIDFQLPLLIGHSFGGSTAIYLASNKSNSSCENFRRRYGIGGLILYDPWMFPLNETLRRNNKISGGGKEQETIHFYSSSSSKHSIQTIPILCLHAEKFQWKENLEFENEIVRIDNQNNDKTKKNHSFIYQIHLSDAGHMNYTEASTIAPYLMSQMKSIGKQDPMQLLHDINEVTTQFIQLIEQNQSSSLKKTRPGSDKAKEDDQETKEINHTNSHQTFLSQINNKKKFNLLFSTTPSLSE